MTPETARTLGYAEGKAAARLAMVSKAAERGLELFITPERNPIFAGRCHLCGETCRGTYCACHSWAYGEALA